MVNLQYLLAGSKLGKLCEIPYTNLAKVGVVGSNPIARSRFLDLIEGSPVTTFRAGRPQCLTECMP